MGSDRSNANLLKFETLHSHFRCGLFGYRWVGSSVLGDGTRRILHEIQRGPRVAPVCDGLLRGNSHGRQMVAREVAGGNCCKRRLQQLSTPDADYLLGWLDGLWLPAFTAFSAMSKYRFA